MFLTLTLSTPLLNTDVTALLQLSTSEKEHFHIRKEVDPLTHDVTYFMHEALYFEFALRYHPSFCSIVKLVKLSLSEFTNMCAGPAGPSTL